MTRLNSFDNKLYFIVVVIMSKLVQYISISTIVRSMRKAYINDKFNLDYWGIITSLNIFLSSTCHHYLSVAIVLFYQVQELLYVSMVHSCRVYSDWKLLFLETQCYRYLKSRLQRLKKEPWLYNSHFHSTFLCRDKISSNLLS